MNFLKTPFVRLLAGATLAAGVSAAGATEALPKLAITVFQAPSQSVWIPALIQRLELDRKHGFDLVVTQKPSRVAYTDYATGKDPVCFCAAIAAVSRFKQQGADITLLWNIFNFESDIVIKKGSVTDISQLEGKTVQADTITGSWALSKWFLQARGVDFNKLSVKSSSVRGAGALAELQLDRVDALLVNPIEGAAAKLQSKGEFDTIPLFDRDTWRKVAETDFVPSIALGTHEKWIADPGNQDLARRFYRANLEAVAFIRDNPAKAAELVASAARLDADVMEGVLVRYKDLIAISPLRRHLGTVALLTQKLLPEGGQLPQPLTDAELDALVSTFDPEG